MKPGLPSIASLKILGPLGRGPSENALLAAEARSRRRGPRWVLKRVGAPGGDDSFRGLLRQDFCELASLGHPALALPVGLRRDAATGAGYLLRPFQKGIEIDLAARGERVADVLPWLTASAEALALLHRFGFLHRNLKPSNLLLSPGALFPRSGRKPRVVLCDPAWWPAGEGRGAAGSAAAPELARGEAPSFASDLYSLGAVFFLLLTGREWRADGDPLSLRPSELNRDLPLDLERVVERLLHPDPSRRYLRASELVEDLERLGGSAPPGAGAPECFAGREEELRRALGRLDPPGRSPVIAVSGEAGMGKTALLRRLALEAQTRGYRTLAGSFFGREEAALGPIPAAIEELLASAPAGPGLRPRYRRLLAGLSPRPGTELPEPEARRWLLRGLLDLLLALRGPSPALLILDGVHLADPLAIELIAGLVRDLAGPQPNAGERPGLSLLLAFRSESPFRSVLRPLLESLQAPGGEQLLIELQPLPAPIVEGWLGMAMPQLEGEARERLASRLQGRPFFVREAVRLRGEGLAELPGPGLDLPALHRHYFASLATEAREALEVLAVLGRPASRAFLARAGGATEARVGRALDPLAGDGTLSDEGGLLFFRHGSLHAWLLDSLGRSKREALHRRLARILEQGKASAGEIAHHWLASSQPGRGVPAALAEARRLARAHQGRRAAALFQAVLGLLPARSRALRHSVAEEMAEALARAGEHRRGVEALRGIIAGRSGREAGRLHGRIGVSLHRAGEPREAEAELEKALALLAGAQGARWRRERLAIDSELADIQSNAGKAVEAEATCRRAIDEIAAAPGARADPRIRRVEMVLFENLAHLRLRSFRYGEARALYEESLRAGKGLGAAPERSLILNNLGILHGQENRFAEAIECYERAGRLSRKLGDELSLAAIESNIAVLRARLGELEAAEHALRRAAQHEGRCDSRRARFLRLHSAGMVDLFSGRLGSAIESFRGAIALGEELGDLYTRVFDLIYLGECHLHRGEARAAQAALERALVLDGGAHRPVRPMVHARRSVLAARRGDQRAARAELDAAREDAAGVSFLHAWNLVFLGGALRFLREEDQAREALEEARGFFSRVKVPWGEVQAVLELAGLEFDAGAAGRGRKRLDGLALRFTPGQGVLRNPLLASRLLLGRSRFLLDEDRLEEAAATLAEAESYLIGRRLEEPEALARELRRRLRERVLDRRLDLAPAWPAGMSSGGLEDLEALRGAAADLLCRFEEELGEERARSLLSHLRGFEERLGETRRALEGRREPPSAPPRAGAIVGRSAAIRAVVSLCLKAGPTDLPVLITGETGTGKELVARAIHGESPRRSGPFVSLSSAALPAELFEAELFGHVRGAFSGAERDRPGLLLGAQGGTFLFDEIGEMPPALQTRILRVLERARVRPLGGEEEQPLDVRYLFTTHRDLRALMEEGKFRGDLYYRIRGLEVALPPLRERLEDLPLLVAHFLSSAGGALGESSSFDAGALRALASYPWPGNVRELQNAVTRLGLTVRGTVGEGEVRRLLGEASPARLFSHALLRSRPLGQLLALLEREHLLLLLADHRSDLRQVAAALGIRERTLYDRLERLGIRPGDRRAADPRAG